MALAHSLDLRETTVGEISSLPHNEAAEQALLGCMLFDNAALERVDSFLKPDHFFEPFHARLYAAIETMVGKGQLAEPIGLLERFKNDEAFGQLGGIRYLADLVVRAPPAFGAGGYARIVYDLALRRELIGLAEEMRQEALDGEASASEQVTEAEQRLFSLAETGKSSSGFVTFADSLTKSLEATAAAYERDGGLSGLATGLIDLDQKLGGLHPSDLIILAARPSMGKAQPLDAKVLMRDGSWRLMGDLRLGDELASVDGAPNRVAGIYPQGVRPIYRVTLGDGRSARACDEHLWQIESCRFDGPRVVSTARLREMIGRVRYDRRVALPLPSGHFGTDNGLLIDPWLMGAMLGNGCMTSGHMSISTADAATLYRVQKVVGHGAVVAAGGAGYDYRINGPDIRSAFREYGLEGKGSPEKFIPTPYLVATRDTRLELLRGLLDTDGWVETFGVIRYGTSSSRLATDITALVRSLGGSCTVSTKQPTFTHKGERREGLTSYTCNIRHPDRPSLISLKRKQRRCENEARFKSPTITTVEPDGEAPVQCIRVTHPSSLYITDDYIVTHNTAAATNIAFHIAKNYAWEPKPDGSRKTTAGGVVAFFSLEMSDEQLASRILAEVSGVPSDAMRRGKIGALEYGRIRDAAMEISSAPLHTDASGALHIGKLAARARRLKRTVGLDLVIVDYLQLATTTRNRNDGRVQEVSEITQGLKALAKELNVPVLALSQLSRQVEQRDDKRPQLSDLRESGSIEQDADVVMFLYREEYYLGRTEPRENTAEHEAWTANMDRCRGQAELIIGKQRHGPIGTVRLSFNENLTKFGNLAREGRYSNSPAGYRDPQGGDR